MCVGLGLVCGAHDAAAERAVVVDAVGVPFAAGELAAALRMRIPAEGDAVHVRITATPAGVRIAAPAGEREVVLGGRQGADAIRLIALTAGDLLLDDELVEPPPPAHAAVGIGVFGAVAGWDGALGQLAVDLAVRRPGWLMAVQLGGGQLLGGAVQLTTAIARADVGLRRGALEVRGGLTVAPVFVSNGVGDQTVLVGGNASARLRVPLGRAAYGVAELGCDVFATRTEYRLAGMASLTTPQLAPWLAAGVEVEL